MIVFFYGFVAAHSEGLLGVAIKNALETTTDANLQGKGIWENLKEFHDLVFQTEEYSKKY